MKILFASSECHPFIKTGGLGDVAYSLPIALKKLGHDVRVILPKYKSIEDKYKSKLKKITDYKVYVGYREQYCGIEELELNGITYYFVDNMYYFDRENAYGYLDDGERFIFFSEAICTSMERVGFVPDVIHLNDWHTSIVSLLLKTKYSWVNAYKNIKSVLTIHNLKFQGVMPYEALGDLLSLGDSFMVDEGVEFFSCINLMKGGINYSDFVTTVSPTYSEEIKYPYFGENLDGLMRRIDYKLTGIINGIDYDLNNPMTDKLIYNNYDINSLYNKRKNKEKLQKELGLPVKDVPLITMISRLTEQKGLDIIIYALNELLKNDIQIVIQGTGDKAYEDALKYFDNIDHEKFRVINKFSPKLAQKLYAAADLFLMPSRFEPCGLSQMISMRYGTVPIVRATGGLKDTVEPYNKFDETGLGFSFNNFNAFELVDAVKKAIETYNNKDSFLKLQKRCMAADFSWDISAVEYEKVYNAVINLR